jgi:hypothetical protein
MWKGVTSQADSIANLLLPQAKWILQAISPT